MPNRTIYIKEDDLPIFSKAQQLGSESISAIIMEALRRYVVDEEKRQDESQQHQRISQIFERIVADACSARSSDIHLQATPNGNRVRIRVDGVLRDIDPIPENMYAEVIRHIKSMAELDTEECAIPQSARIFKEIGSKKCDMFISVLPAVLGEAMTIRLIWQGAEIPALDRLEPEGEHGQALAALADKSHGLIFVTGPTGSGKTTTLYSMLGHPTQRERKVITIENPVEVVIADSVQIQANYARDASFARVLRSVLPGDPDVIMVGEIRNQETAQICMEAAIIGRLVLSVLHTRSAASALVRLVDLGIEPFLLRDALTAVIGQALIRKLCDDCKRPEDIRVDQARFKVPIPKNAQFFRTEGCNHCASTGYRGQLALYEILIPGKKIYQALFQNTSADALEQIAVKEGMKTLLEDAVVKASKGYTSIAEIARFQKLNERQ